MLKTNFKKISFYYRTDVEKTVKWQRKIEIWIKKNSPKTRILPANTVPKNKKNAPQLLVVLGGDGTILEAAQRFQPWNPLILGLNLGHVGFLASVREEKNFIRGVAHVFHKKYRAVPHMLIRASLFRRGKKIFSSDALNDIAVQNLWGLVDIEVLVDGHPTQYIHGNGVLISTATGSTAYNLSAHGPIVMPDIKCMIITELLDHNIPTPSLIIKRNRTITLKIDGFRQNNRFTIRKTNQIADVVLVTDTDKMIALEKGDQIIVKKSDRLIRFAELDKNYFFSSLQEKFAFR